VLSALDCQSLDPGSMLQAEVCLSILSFSSTCVSELTNVSYYSSPPREASRFMVVNFVTFVCRKGADLLLLQNLELTR